MNITLEANKSYIQKNPLFGRKVIHFDRIRPSVWDWDLCDCSIVMIDKDPETAKLTSVASVVYDHQGLVEIPDIVFRKIEGLVKMYEATSRVVDEQKLSVLRQETMGKIVELLSDNGIIEEDTYSAAQMKAYAEQYDRYSRQQMEHVTDVIDVHK